MSELLSEISMYLKMEDILNSENMIPIENIKELIDELQQKENIIKEVREYIETEYLSKFDDFEKPFILTDKNDWNKVLEILEKEKIKSETFRRSNNQL